jgi:hypothetical protein
MRRFLSTVLRWSAAGAGLGGVAGAALLLVSLVGGRHVWAGMLLLAGVLSWPAGIWTFEPLTRAIEAGIPGAELGSLIAGPVMNGAALGALLGCLVWAGVGRAGAPSTTSS